MEDESPKPRRETPKRQSKTSALENFVTLKNLLEGQTEISDCKYYKRIPATPKPEKVAEPPKVLNQQSIKLFFQNPSRNESDLQPIVIPANNNDDMEGIQTQRAEMKKEIDEMETEIEEMDTDIEIVAIVRPTEKKERPQATIHRFFTSTKLVPT